MNEKPAAERILIRCPNWVGDVVMATPAIQCIRENYPDAFIAVLVNAYTSGVLDGMPWIDEIIEYDPRDAHRGVRRYWRFAGELRRRRFDLAVVLPHSLSSAWMVWLSRAAQRVGYDRGDRKLLLTHRLEPQREDGGWLPVPKTTLYLDLCRWLGLEVRSERPRLFVSKAESDAAMAVLRRYGVPLDRSLLAINPGAKFGSAKCWPPERFARVADLMMDRFGWACAITCGPGEDSIGRAVAGASDRGAIHLPSADMSLAKLKGVIARSSMLITNDTGPRHFAVAFDKPVVVVMGSADPRHTACNLEKTTVVRHDLECSPCQLRTCPRDHECMTMITAEQVFEAVTALIPRTSSKDGD